jgi:hydrogenase-4 component B
MTLSIALSCNAALLMLAGFAVVLGRRPIATSVVYGLCSVVAMISLFVALKNLLGAAPLESTILPWLGAHFRIDALAAFFLAKFYPLFLPGKLVCFYPLRESRR